MRIACSSNAKFLTVAAATLALTLGGLSTAFAETSTSPDATTGTDNGERREHAGWQDVRSHTGRPITGTHTATEKGAVGTDAPNSEGTSDRTPDKQNAPSEN